MAILKPEQEAEFMRQLQQGDGLPPENGGALPPETQEAALRQGAEMAQADAQAGAQPGADAPGQPSAPSPADPSVETVQALGFSSVDELAQAYQAASQQSEQYKHTLAQLVAFEQAQQTQDDLDPNAPDYAVKKAIREEMAPLTEKMREDARNRLVQDAWGQSASEMPGLEELMPDIAEYMKGAPQLAVSEDGLRRAYDGVRSRKYRSETELMDDPEFVKRAAGSEKIKQAVLEAHLGEIARSGDALPATIGEGGGTPLTGKKQPPTAFEQAKTGLLKMLGG